MQTRLSRDILWALGLRIGGALAWLAYTWALARLLPPEALGTTLYALALAGLLGGLLVAGWAGQILREGARAMRDLDTPRLAVLLGQGLWQTLWHGALLAVALTACAAVGALPRLTPAWPIATLVGGTALALATLGVLANALRAQGGLIPALTAQGLLRALLPLAATLGFATLWPLSFTAIISLYFGSICLLLPDLLRRLPRPRWRRVTSGEGQTLRSLWGAQAGGQILAHLDVLVLGWMLSPVEAALYLVARRCAGLLALVFDGLRAALAPRLASSFPEPRAFSALSARVNLGFLLIGAGGAGTLVLAGPFLLPLFGSAFAPALPAFLWLVLGQTAPALFGATGMLMVMTDMERARARLAWALMPFGTLFLIWGAAGGITRLAMAAAGLQLALGAASAILLALRHGVLPGATALLHTRLRLS